MFSATISTADSQILAYSAAITQDLSPILAKSYKFAKVGTLIVKTVILVIALAGSNNVFSLVTFSWSALAYGLGPLLILKVLQRRVSILTAISMIGVGIATALIWNLGLNISSTTYEVLPGMTSKMIVYEINQLLRNPHLSGLCSSI